MEQLCGSKMQGKCTLNQNCRLDMTFKFKDALQAAETWHHHPPCASYLLQGSFFCLGPPLRSEPCSSHQALPPGYTTSTFFSSSPFSPFQLMWACHLTQVLTVVNRSLKFTRSLNWHAFSPLHEYISILVQNMCQIASKKIMPHLHTACICTTASIKEYFLS